MEVTAPEPRTFGVPGLLLRLLLFGVLTAGLSVAAGVFLPSGDLVAGAWALGFGGVVAGWTLLRWDGRPSSDLGLSLDRRAGIDGVVGWMLGVFVAGVVLSVAAIAGGVEWRADGAEFTVSAWVGEAVRTLALLAIPAAAEEVLLRGYVLVASAAVLGPGAALAITSVVFGLLHAANPGAGPMAVAGVTAAGLLLGALVLRFHSLWPAIGAHLGWNWALAAPGDVSVSGLDIADVPGYDGAPTGPDWLSGGAFGVEAGLVAALALSAAAWAVWHRPLRPTTTTRDRDPR
ncbi:CPBP family intramembrane glutamic endopeptidase [Gaopeijia maritima]|uniref:CPBP family intramembrane glutamic endopeptidase n=1 Tax=Gaopeijia maritima TaxID=3119007 RepID=UPI0032891ADE